MASIATETQSQPIDSIKVDGEGGASANERLLFSAKQDLDELFYELESEGGYDINFKDGLGNTALHYAVMNSSPTVLELILEHDGADVDLLNKQGLTPLHCSIQIDQPKHRLLIAKSLIEAGADPRIKNKYHQTPLQMLKSVTSTSKNEEDEELERCLMEAEAELSIDHTDVVNDEFEGEDSDVASVESSST
ncbi:hypothetical protein CROQUDRAFT_662874 [Cronartium quercuum f. sp. fusiforme G11]|uniref:Uncharacterized protein n=1 Tax=Cronartium quercuum f. sp. fusiforme G11 TaxID=708437 RepID=A0A9P6NDR9_9BASI|nr:hypothetical protein CROQUDRAFT_662874 [Cronartium quercuum f. sp. fusiforme G11]